MNKNVKCFCIFCVKLYEFCKYATLQYLYKHNIGTVLGNIKCICARLQTERQASQRLDFLPVSKARSSTQIHIISADNIRILSISCIIDAIYYRICRLVLGVGCKSYFSHATN
jgi:hypothetical protein